MVNGRPCSVINMVVRALTAATRVCSDSLTSITFDDPGSTYENKEVLVKDVYIEIKKRSCALLPARDR